MTRIFFCSQRVTKHSLRRNFKCNWQKDCKLEFTWTWFSLEKKTGVWKLHEGRRRGEIEKPKKDFPSSLICPSHHPLSLSLYFITFLLHEFLPPLRPVSLSLSHASSGRCCPSLLCFLTRWLVPLSKEKEEEKRTEGKEQGRDMTRLSTKCFGLTKSQFLVFPLEQNAAIGSWLKKRLSWVYVHDLSLDQRTWVQLMLLPLCLSWVKMSCHQWLRKRKGGNRNMNRLFPLDSYRKQRGYNLKLPTRQIHKLFSLFFQQRIYSL